MMAKFYIRDEVPKANICVYGFDNQLSEKEEFRSHYNDLFFMSQLKADVELITKIGLENRNTGLSDIVAQYETHQDTTNTLNDGLLFSNASSFYRKLGGAQQGTRYLLNECLTYPSLNIFAYCANLRHANSPSFMDYQAVFDSVNNVDEWKAQLPMTRFSSIGNQFRPSFNGLYADNGQRVAKSISEIYLLQTFRPEFEHLPEMKSKKLKICALEGFKLTSDDILGFKREKKQGIQDDCSIDVQGALINNPAQISAIIQRTLAGTVQKGYHNSMISIDVDKYLIEEFRETLIGIEELNTQVMVDLK